MRARDALIVVDVQNDFCAGGALAVKGGDEVVPVLNDVIDQFAANGLPIFATRDWHPEKTSHFKAYGGLWPVHCVQGKRGAQFHPGLHMSPDIIVVLSKGTRPDEEGYSGFQASDAAGTGLAELLHRKGVERLFVGGLATDYCVKHTVLDGLKEGFKVMLLIEAIRAVDVNPGDGERAIDEMVRAGAVKVHNHNDLSS